VNYNPWGMLSRFTLGFEAFASFVNQDSRSRRCLFFSNYQTSSLSFFYFSYNPSYYSLLVMICDANSMQVVQPHPPCVTCQGLCVHCLLTMLCQSFIFNNFEGKYSKFFPLSSLLDFVVNKFPKFVTLLPTHGDHVSPLKPKKKWLSYESTY
jgi:hypothetical protein